MGAVQRPLSTWHASNEGAGYTPAVQMFFNFDNAGRASNLDDTSMGNFHRVVGVENVGRDVGMASVGRGVGMAGVGRGVGMCSARRDMGMGSAGRGVIFIDDERVTRYGNVEYGHAGGSVGVWNAGTVNEGGWINRGVHGGIRSAASVGVGFPDIYSHNVNTWEAIDQVDANMHNTRNVLVSQANASIDLVDCDDGGHNVSIGLGLHGQSHYH
jgi:hypothetical protein